MIRGFLFERPSTPLLLSLGALLLGGLRDDLEGTPYALAASKGRLSPSLFSLSHLRVTVPFVWLAIVDGIVCFFDDQREALEGRA